MLQTVSFSLGFYHVHYIMLMCHAPVLNVFYNAVHQCTFPYGPQKY